MLDFPKQFADFEVFRSEHSFKLYPSVQLVS
jgi:hypothetical protein